METKKPHIGDLYPHLPDEQLQEADENLKRYFEHALGMYERIKRDPDAYASFTALTGSLKKSYHTEQKVDCSSKIPTRKH